mmetsp:Transcript_4421/g.5340  ORF Transcript_4421/g.5340 Transcript_4421/m.5340 type:complete len:108 (-) Transcript_4421:203-526(-)
MVITSEELTATDYSVTITEIGNSKYNNSIIGLISIILGACIMIVVFTCCFAVIRVCFQIRGRNIIERNRAINSMRLRDEHNLRLRQLLEENPAVSYKNITVQFGQTS